MPPNVTPPVMIGRRRRVGNHDRRPQSAGHSNATAELASVERCSGPETPAPRHPTPPRSLPAGSDVQRQNVPAPRPARHPAACLRGAMFPAGYRRPENFTSRCQRPPRNGARGTSPHPDEPGGGGEVRAEPHDLILNMAPRWRAPWWPRKPGRILAAENSALQVPGRWCKLLVGEWCS